METISERIRRLRGERSRKDLGEKVGVVDFGCLRMKACFRFESVLSLLQQPPHAATGDSK